MRYCQFLLEVMQHHLARDQVTSTPTATRSSSHLAVHAIVPSLCLPSFARSLRHQISNWHVLYKQSQPSTLAFSLNCWDRLTIERVEAVTACNIERYSRGDLGIFDLAATAALRCSLSRRNYTVVLGTSCGVWRTHQLTLPKASQQAVDGCCHLQHGYFLTTFTKLCPCALDQADQFWCPSYEVQHATSPASVLCSSCNQLCLAALTSKEALERYDDLLRGVLTVHLTCIVQVQHLKTAWHSYSPAAPVYWPVTPLLELGIFK